MKKLIQIFILFLSTFQLFPQNTNCDPPVITDISPISPCLYAGDTMYFSSITTNADSYLWTFGNGDTTTHQEGEIVFENEGYYCVTLEVFNVCGTKHYSEVVYVLPNECACPQNMAYDIHDTIYTTNQTWNLGNFPSGEVIVDGDIFIQQGANMFIEDLTIRFSPRGKIIVDTAATLTIDNSTLTNLGGSCDYMWQGIEVRGTNMMGSNELFQGVIKIDTAVTIENAHIGVLLGERNMDYICDNNNSWGEFYTASAGGLIMNWVKVNNYVIFSSPY